MDIQEEVQTGTTILAVSYSNGVVLGTDTRTTRGGSITNRAAVKTRQLSENTFVTTAGSAADTQTIARYVRYFTAQHQAELQETPPVVTVARFVQQLCYNNKNSLRAGMIVGGWDEKLGGQVLSIPIGGAAVKVPFAIGGSGSKYIYGFCDDNWKSDMRSEEHTSELQSRIRISYAVFCLKKKKNKT
eukprot:TRINITY_DN3140_c0_g3_i3.p2 TRINITY_DN3140_c0_g3~~TRINITY_DN3140_c0_g3_i3.p2  ORF type:complete len:187 (-),score=26.34 TRINITY_DN3140_c0_g3_i3:5-565(-)